MDAHTRTTHQNKMPIIQLHNSNNSRQINNFCRRRRTMSSTTSLVSMSWQLLLLLVVYTCCSTTTSVLVFTVEATTTTQQLTSTTTSTSDNRKRNKKERLEALYLATNDYVNTFGPLPSQQQQQQQEEEVVITTASTTATVNDTSSTTELPQQQQSSPHVVAQRASLVAGIGDFFVNLFETIFNPNVQCRLFGFLPFVSSTCICQEDNLRRAIVRAGISFDNPTPITLCAGTIILRNSNIRNSNKKNNNVAVGVQYEPINVTNKSFFIGCAATKRTIQLLPSTCTISGNGQQTIFHGNPIQLFLQNIQLVNGYAKDVVAVPTNSTDTGGFGGAIHLTGGKTFMDSVTLQNNRATLGGGAIYVGPTAQLTMSMANFVNNHVLQQFNSTTTIGGGGGAIYIDGGVVIAAGGRYSDNTVKGYGGAVLAVEASIRLEDIAFDTNQATELGGAIATERSIAQLSSTTFERNTALNTANTGNALYIADDLDDDIDGSYVYCDPTLHVNFCYGFDDGTAIYEIPGGTNSNTNCQEVGKSDIFAEQCPNYIP